MWFLNTGRPISNPLGSSEKVPRQSGLSLAASPLAVMVMAEQRTLERSVMRVMVTLEAVRQLTPTPLFHPDMGTAVDLDGFIRKH